jgi:DNA-binding response OmpR family regulator
MAGERILILNTAVDTVEALEALLGDEGYQVIAKYVRDLRQGEDDGEKMLEEAKPNVVIFDVAPPIEENWKAFMRFRPFAKTRGIPIVLTTTVEKEVRKYAGDHEIIELLLKPFDLQLLLDVVAVAVGRKQDVALAAKWFPAS